IKALINHELEVPSTIEGNQPWQIRASELLNQQRLVQTEILNISLEELFTTSNDNSNDNTNDNTAVTEIA
ncbi:MAG: hypothetical protein P8L39_16665, partial [Halioglobus sp.]|nr:hypothetical protein [Halioglobus sp.]